ncbi:hypothetical protein FSP39_011862 [Pinctada imbricata]|uniref:RING-type domain-containing protein n=1 Tax=Pinctada imbricata TaxID=66713 RepID=A0AA88XZ23_PINIB|nr:hypothetical protein FSP39_011862 [Pinctada imbricata]
MDAGSGIIQVITRCGICEGTIRDPRRLSCLHTFCSRCLETLVNDSLDEESDDTIECPICGHKGPYQNSKRDRLVEVLLDVTNYGAQGGEEPPNTESAKEALQKVTRRCQEQYSVIKDSISKGKSAQERCEDEIEIFYSNLILDLTGRLHEQKERLKEELGSKVKAYEGECNGAITWLKLAIVSLSTRSNLVEAIEQRSYDKNSASNILQLLQDETKSYLAQSKLKIPQNGEYLFLPRRDNELMLEQTNFGSVVFDTEVENELSNDESSDVGTMEEQEDQIEQAVSDLNIEASYTDDQESTLNNEIHETSVQNVQVSQNDFGALEIPRDTMSNEQEAQNEVVTPGPLRSLSSVEQPADTPPPYWSVVNEDSQRPRIISSSDMSSSRQSQRIFVSTPLQFAKHTQSIQTRVDDDQKAGPIVGISWMRDKIIFIDRWNSKIKLFHENGNFLHSIHCADGEPFDVTNTTTHAPGNYEETCAVTIPRKRTILMLKVDNSLVITNRIMTYYGYPCISWDGRQSCFVCGTSPPFGNPQVDIFDIRGQIIRSFSVDYRRKLLFTQVRSIDVSESGIISVCDWKRNRVLFLKMDGTIVGSYNGTSECPLVEPVGTCTDGRGNLMISDSKSNSIHIVGHDGEFLGVLKTSCKTPKPKEINIRLYGPPKLALSHGSVFIEVFEMFEEDPFPRAIPTAPPVADLPPM